MIDPHIIEREQECLEMRENITQNNEKLFETTFTFIIFASTLEELDEYSESLIAEGKKENVTIQPFFHMQEKGFNVTLPLCYNALDTRRTLTSSSLAVMIPFSNLEINERGGINYTMNANSKNLILSVLFILSFKSKICFISSEKSKVDFVENVFTKN